MEHQNLNFVGEQALHSVNASGTCQYCGRLWEEMQTGKFQCTGYQGFKFTGTEYLKAPRHPLFVDSILAIRTCNACTKRKQGFCKKHDALQQFLY